MTETIRSLWNGNLCPIQYFGLENRDMKELQSLLQRNREKLTETLNEAEKERLEKYTNCINEYLSLSNEQAFCDGFCLAVRMMTEAMSGDT